MDMEEMTLVGSEISLANKIVGYGVANIPSQSGTFDIECAIWKPLGTLKERISEMLIGGAAQVKDETIVWNGEDRRKLTTISVGVVHLHLNILLRSFGKYNVQTTDNSQHEVNDDYI
jgi:B9 domain-containing protein 2